MLCLSLVVYLSVHVCICFRRVFEGCLLINKLLFNNYSLIESYIDIQIDTLLSKALGYHAGCPLLKGRIRFIDQPIALPANLIRFNALRKVIIFIYIIILFKYHYSSLILLL